MTVAEKVGLFKGMVDKDAISIPVRSSKLFTLAALYDANTEMLRPWSDGAMDEDGLVDIALEYWAAIVGVMTHWTKVKEGDMRALELRQTSICSHTVVLRAIGGIGAIGIGAVGVSIFIIIETIVTDLIIRPTRADRLAIHICAEKFDQVITIAEILEASALSQPETEIPAIATFPDLHHDLVEAGL